jgi:hypothetical protein
MADALKELAELFAPPRTSVSSFQLLQNGVIDAREGEHGLSRTFTI